MTSPRLLLFFLFPAVAAAQPELVTDRPDFTESAVTVPRGALQFEAGATWDRTGGATTASGPELLVRWAPADRFELRLGLPDYVGGDGPGGFGDGSLGLKAQLGPVGAWDLGLIATASLPTAEDGLGSGTVDPELILTAGRALGGRFALGGQLVGERDGAADLWVGGATLVLGAALGTRWGAFLETVVTAPEDGPAAVLLHHGYTFALTPALQLDAHAGLGLTDAAPELLLGAGISARR